MIFDATLFDLQEAATIILNSSIDTPNVNVLSSPTSTFTVPSRVRALCQGANNVTVTIKGTDIDGNLIEEELLLESVLDDYYSAKYYVSVYWFSSDTATTGCTADFGNDNGIATRTLVLSIQQSPFNATVALNNVARGTTVTAEVQYTVDDASATDFANSATWHTVPNTTLETGSAIVGLDSAVTALRGIIGTDSGISFLDAWEFVFIQGEQG